MATQLISVVDDDHSVRESLHSLFRSVGFEVRTFGSAEAFLDSADLVATDCLILDIHMPGMDGLALRRRLKFDHPEMPVILITAHGTEEETRSRAAEEGVVDYLIKPLSEDAVLTAVNAALTVT